MTQVGFIGLGIRGKPMALDLLKTGYSMCVLERNKAAGELVGAGARAFRNNKEIGKEFSVPLYGTAQVAANMGAMIQEQWKLRP